MNPGLGRSPGEGKGSPLQYSGLESMGLSSPWACKESDTTERLSPSQLINNVVRVSGEQQRDSATHRHVPILPQTRLPSRLPHNIEQGSLCCTVGPCWLFILNIAVCTIVSFLLRFHTQGMSYDIAPPLTYFTQYDTMSTGTTFVVPAMDLCRPFIPSLLHLAIWLFFSSLLYILPKRHWQ